MASAVAERFHSRSTEVGEASSTRVLGGKCLYLWWLSSTGTPACAASRYLHGVDETRKRQNAFFDSAGIARNTPRFTLGQAGMPVLLKGYLVCSRLAYFADSLAGGSAGAWAWRIFLA